MRRYFFKSLCQNVISECPLMKIMEYAVGDLDNIRANNKETESTTKQYFSNVCIYNVVGACTLRIVALTIHQQFSYSFM